MSSLFSNFQWANCGIAKHHGSLVTEQNFAKHGDRIFSSTGSFINSNLWKTQIIVQLNLNLKKSVRFVLYLCEVFGLYKLLILKYSTCRTGFSK